MFKFRTAICEGFGTSSDEQTIKPEDGIDFCFESFERFESGIEVRVEEFNEVSVVGAVGNCLECKQFFSTSVNLYEYGLTQRNVLTALCPDRFKSDQELLLTLVLVKHLLLECVEK